MSKLKPLYPHEFLSWMAVPGYQGIYILGSFARHVTIYSQQMRAFNLIDALCKTGQLRPKTKVAVVGGGVAGLTAAAAAAVRDARVTVIESDKDFFPIQRNAGNRYLHPHIYDWPLFEAETGRANTADFPFLGWEADDADKVFRKLKESWDNLLKDYPRLTKPKTVMEANVTGLHRDAHWIVETDAPYEKNPGEVKTVEAEIVILAVGFGRELGRADVMRYWEQAPFDAVPETTLRWLVSGYGDGGLTDLMRLCIDGFRHDEFVKKHEADPTLATKLRNLLTANERENVRSVFDDLLGELGEESLIGPDQLRMKTKVVFNAPADYLEFEGSSILNRFLVFQLEKLRAFTRQDGKMRSIPAADPKDRKYTVEFLNENQEVISTEVFDRLIVRHGPVRPISDKSFPEIWTATEELRKSWAAQLQSNDRTRVQMWDPADYDPAKAPNPITLKDEPPSKVDVRCVIVESTMVRKLNQLETLVRTAFSSNKESIGFNITQRTDVVLKPEFEKIKVNEALSGQKEFNSALKLLCRADMAVIDVTGYEPGVMLLLGIRSAVRRGVTIVTTNSKLDSTEWSRLPFNLKELYPVSLFCDDEDITREAHLKREVGDAVARAFGQYYSVPFYQDVPAYEAVRRFDPPLEEGAQQQILWLCSFDPRYAKHGHAIYIQNGYLATYGAKESNKAGESERRGKNEPKYLLTRIIDVVSPQLVTQKLYSAIRSTPLCLVDWTFWSANVFFELGVRLAVSNFGPICLVAANAAEISNVKDAEGKPVENVITNEIQEQRNALKKLFQPLEYGDQGREQELFDEIRERHTAMQNYGASHNTGKIPPAFGAFPFDHTHNFVGRLLRLQDEPGASDVHRFLSAAANSLIGPGPSEPVLPVLYSNVNDDLENQVRLAGKEMLLAAWFYLGNRYADECRQPGHLQDEYRDLGIRLVNLLGLSGDPKDWELRKLIDRELRGLKKGN